MSLNLSFANASRTPNMSIENFESINSAPLSLCSNSRTRCEGLSSSGERDGCASLWTSRIQCKDNTSGDMCGIRIHNTSARGVASSQSLGTQMLHLLARRENEHPVHDHVWLFINLYERSSMERRDDDVSCTICCGA